MTIFAKSILLPSILVALASTSAMAQTAAPAAAPSNTLSYNVGVVSDYRYRGISQSRLQPALQGGVDFAHSSGAYVGARASTIKWVKDVGGDSDVELDIYGGYKGTAGAFGYDVGVLTYVYPSNGLAPSANTTELYVAGTVGPATLKYSHALTDTFGFADSKNSSYVDLSATFDLGKGFSLVPHLGYQRIAKTSAASCTDYSLTLAKDFGNGLAVTAAVVGTDADKEGYVTPAGKFTGKAGVVVGLKYSF